MPRGRRRDPNRPALSAPVDPRHDFRARACELCGKTHAVTFHAWQLPSGRMTSVQAHLRCFRQLQAGTVQLKRG